MAYNGSGNWITPSGQPVVTGTVIQSSTFNTLVADIASTFNNVVTRDGQGPMTAAFKLQSGTVTIPGLSFNSESSTGLYWPSVGALAFTTSGIEIMRLKSNGAVLIDTTTDDGINKLQVAGGVLSTTATTSGLATHGSLNVTGTSTLTGATTANSLTSSGATITGGSINSAPVGATTPSTGSFTTLSASGSTTLNNLNSSGAAISGGSINNASVGATTPSTGKFTTLATASTSTLASPVGIGAAPTTTLDVAVTGGMLRVGGGSGNNLIQAYSSGGTLGLWAGGSSQIYSNSGLSFTTGATTGTSSPTGGTTSLVLDTAGNVGIGVAPSAWGSAKAAIESAGYALWGGTSSNFLLGNNVYQNSGGTYIYKNTAAASMYYQNAGAHTWFNTPSGTAGNTIPWTTAMILDGSGNLGIGKTPTTVLDVSSASIASSANSINLTNTQSGAQAALSVTGSTFSFSGVGASSAILSTGSPNTNLALGPLGAGSGVIQFVANGAERARIDATGNLGIGVTPSAWSTLKSIEGTSGSLAFNGTTATYLNQNLYFNGSAWIYKNNGFGGVLVNSGGGFQFNTATGGSAGAVASLVQTTTIDTSGNFSTIGGVTAAASAGFTSNNYVGNARNPIWRFSSPSDVFGISYFQGSAGLNAADSIGFHFGTATAAASTLNVASTGATVTGLLRVTGQTTLNATASSTIAESFRTVNDGGYITFWNSANTVRTGFLQGNTGANVILAAESGASLVFNTGNTTRLTITSAGVIQDTVAEIGWKDVPANSQASAYTLVFADRGKQILTTSGGVTVPQSVFNVGNVVSIVNNSGTAQTVTQGAGVTLHMAGTTNVGNRTLAPWGIATVLCIGSSVFVVSGNVT